MAIFGTVLSVLASLAMLVFGIQILIAAFKTSAGWGLASLLLPFAVFVYVAKHWEQTKTPFLRSAIALVVVMVGVGISVAGAVMTGGAAQ
jgi:hypothetical protein